MDGAELMTPQNIAREALVEVRAHEAEHDDTYWLGFLVAALERIAGE